MTFLDSPASPLTSPCRAVVIGGGPAGLMAAEVLASSGHLVDLYDAMPSVGRKFLLAGKGGMNLTHSEPQEPFLSRFGRRTSDMAPLLARFGAQSMRDWVHGLGMDTFVGSSGRVFPTDMKAAPLLRAWLKRLREAGVHFHMRHRWTGWDAEGALCFSHPEGNLAVQADAVVLALGGASWARLGSDGAWMPLLDARGIQVTPLKPANCGFDIAWSEHFTQRFAGQPVKSVIGSSAVQQRQGELIVTATGIEGGLVYALAAGLRDQIEAEGYATLFLDLAPGKKLQRVIDEVAQPRGSRSMASHLQSKVGITGVKAGLLREVATAADYADAERLAHAIKRLPLRLLAPRPIDEAISCAGGVRFEGLDAHLMIKDLPGVFCAGEMLDWEAPTGGYLLTGCFASGHAAGLGAIRWLEKHAPK